MEASAGQALEQLQTRKVLNKTMRQRRHWGGGLDNVPGLNFPTNKISIGYIFVLL
jgi:hypothetical protein